MKQDNQKQLSIPDILKNLALSDPDKTAYTFITDASEVPLIYTYAEFDKRVRNTAGYLQMIGKRNDRILLFFQPGLDYITGFFACLYAGMVPVPSYPPKINRADIRIETMLQDAGAAIVLTVQSILMKMDKLFETKPALKNIEWIDFEAIPNDSINNYKPVNVRQNELAYLQYTSGSTSNPKGVMITYENVIHNLETIHNNFGLNNQSRGVVWLPPYHDMGLVGGILEPIYGGFPVTLMSPFSFLQKPFTWLKAVSDYKATTSGGPNFAYELCVQKITEEEKKQLDLSSWEVAFNGAEPVREDTMLKFYDTFKEYGFRKEAFHPCHGLAEGTLIVTGKNYLELHLSIDIDADKLGRNLVEISTGDNSKTLVSSGKVFKDVKVKIVDPEKLTECGDSEIGEVWTASKSVAGGYWKQEEQTTKTFGAVLSDGEGPFLRTGDLGFLRNGELYISGRIKDLIIIRGRNFYPQDIEYVIEKSHPGFVPGSSAAFSIEAEGEEKLAGVFEIKRDFAKQDLKEIVDAARKAVSEQFEIQLYTIVFIRFMSIPKTSSGKIQRQLCKKKFLEDDLQIIGKSIIEEMNQNQPEIIETNTKAESPEVDDFILSTLKLVSQKADKQNIISMYLRKKISKILKRREDEIDILENLAVYGLDSLMTIDLTHLIEVSLRVNISMAEILEGISIQKMSGLILDRMENIAEVIRSSADKVIPDEYPLSQGQQALWFIQKMSPANSAYNLSYAFKMIEPLDCNALEKAFTALTRMHPALRTRFIMKDGNVLQKIEKEFVFEMKKLDLMNLSESACKELLIQKANEPFDLETLPLWRVFIGKQNTGDYLLLLVFHHIITDFWSLSYLASDLGGYYSRIKKTGTAGEIKESGSYYHFIEWQREYLEKNQPAEEFWKKELSGDIQPVSINTDLPRPPVQTFKGDSVFTETGKPLSDEIRRLCGQYNCTPFVFLLSVFYVFLYRYTGQMDIIVGTPSASRKSAQFFPISGYFINPIPIRTRFEGSESFRNLLETVRTNVLRVFENQYYPFKLIVDKLQSARDLSRSPIFQIMFSYQKSPNPELAGLSGFSLNEMPIDTDISGLKVRLLPLGCQSSQFDLTLLAADIENRFAFSFQYNTGLFTKDTIQRMSTEFITLLDVVCRDMKNPLTSMQFLPDSKKDQLLREWNSTKAEYPNKPLFKLFEAQADKRPDAIAILFEGESITYSELNQRANRIAHYLKRIGVKEESVVPVCLERSLNLIAALLGILKAGGYYLPLDPIYPKDRIALILEDISQNGAIPSITEEKFLHYFSFPFIKPVCLDKDNEDINKESSLNPDIKVSLHNLAYMIYTSGSTGKPKGVQIPHRAIVNFLNSMRKNPGLIEEDTLLSVTTISFDIAGLEIFLPLTTGAKVILMNQKTITDGKALAEEIDKNNVTVMQATPSVWRLLLDNGWKGSKTLKILCGGEAFPPELAEKLVQCSGEVWNMYGPTETTVWSSIYKIEEVRYPIPIGKPIDNTQMYILDSRFNPVPVGVTGDLYIGGDGVARGYYNRKELTDERFIKNPFINDNESRIYKTGDLARYLPDGNIEFLSRSDFQVKIRGFRIELGEIESVLSKHESIKESIVIVREDKPQDKRLIAYCICSNPGVTTSGLRHYLIEKLPEYMIPSYFVFLKEFPKTPNGKIDRKTLPVPDYIRPELESVYVAPKSHMEQKIALIWQDALKLDKIGVNDNFFELGGNSMLMVQMHTKLEPEFPEKPISIVEMFQYPTISSLAVYLSQNTSYAGKTLDEENVEARKNKISQIDSQRDLRKKSRLDF